MGSVLLISHSLQAANIRFESGVVVGSNSYGFDSNDDSVDDVIFSTTDPLGFANENLYLNNPEFFAGTINAAVLSVSTNNNPSLRVDFINGVQAFTFHYIFFSSTGHQVNVDVFDSNHNLLGSSFAPALSTHANHNTLPNAIFRVPFSGTASYAFINASGNDSARFGIDDFQGLFSSNDLPKFNIPSAIPIPAAAWLFVPVLLGLAGIRRRKK
jgi:hypothetical protein